MRRVKRASGGRLRAASLVEAVVAAVGLLIVFTAEPYRQYRDVQLITIEVRIDGSRKRIVHRQLVECAE